MPAERVADQKLQEGSAARVHEEGDLMPLQVEVRGAGFPEDLVNAGPEDDRATAGRREREVDRVDDAEVPG